MDVMHVEKNFCDSIIDTLLNIKGKIKDDVNVRLDMAKHGSMLNAKSGKMASMNTRPIVTNYLMMKNSRY
jgi:hypothetical protein